MVINITSSELEIIAFLIKRTLFLLSCYVNNDRLLLVNEAEKIPCNDSKIPIKSLLRLRPDRTNAWHWFYGPFTHPDKKFFSWKMSHGTFEKYKPCTIVYNASPFQALWTIQLSTMITNDSKIYACLSGSSVLGCVFDCFSLNAGDLYNEAWNSCQFIFPIKPPCDVKGCVLKIKCILITMK